MVEGRKEGSSLKARIGQNIIKNFKNRDITSKKSEKLLLEKLSFYCRRREGQIRSKEDDPNVYKMPHFGLQ